MTMTSLMMHTDFLNSDPRMMTGTMEMMVPHMEMVTRPHTTLATKVESNTDGDITSGVASEDDGDDSDDDDNCKSLVAAKEWEDKL
ncbi:hypothetical protein GGH15_004178 [Coemansia sp. RSA 562]|nr:hypothetical protein GGH15_004178 [Coemansia sp. RSA 562]